MFARYKVILCASCLLILSIAAVLLHGRQAAEAATLSWGSSGNEVVQVQQKLSQWGYYKGPLDGYYAYETYRAVQNFQRNNGLPQDGVVGTATRNALGLHTPDALPAVSRGVATDRGEVNLLARVIEGEAADEALTGKIAVGAVIMNRTKSASFPRTISGVIFQDHAFESISNGQAYRPLSQASVEAAQMAMSGYDPTGGAIFFWNPAKPVNPWVWSRNVITRIGNHVFAR